MIDLMNHNVSMEELFSMSPVELEMVAGLSNLDIWRIRSRSIFCLRREAADFKQDTEIAPPPSSIENEQSIEKHQPLSHFPHDSLSPNFDAYSLENLNYTSVRCNGADCCDSLYINRSCVWTNLYYIDGQFRALYLEGHAPDPNLEASSVVSVGIRRPLQLEDRFPTLFQPAAERFASPVHLERFLAALQAEAMPGTHLLLARSTPFNFGHAVLDDLYAVWLAASELRLASPDGPLTGVVLPVSIQDPCCPNARARTRYADLASAHYEQVHWEACCQLEGVLRAFLGSLVFVADWDPEAPRRIDAAVAGAGQKGFMTPTRDYRLPGGGGPLRRFRDRFYAAFRAGPPPAAGGLRVVLVPNKRDYGDALDPPAVAAALRAAGARGAAVEALDFGGPMAAQVRAVRGCRVLVTGVGTGATAAFLLPDGAAGVNLGTAELTGADSYHSDEPIFAAMPWARWTYAPAPDRRSAAAVARLVIAAAAGAPGAAGDNRSPVGRAVAAYFQADAGAWAAYVGAGRSGSRHDLECMGGVTRAERLLCEQWPWSPVAQGGTGCADLDRALLRRLRAQHGVACGQPPPPGVAGAGPAAAAA